MIIHYNPIIKNHYFPFLSFIVYSILLLLVLLYSSLSLSFSIPPWYPIIYTWLLSHHWSHCHPLQLYIYIYHYYPRVGNQSLSILIHYYNTGWWFGTWMDYDCPFSWKFHHPKWLSLHDFSEGKVFQPPTSMIIYPIINHHI